MHPRKTRTVDRIEDEHTYLRIEEREIAKTIKNKLTVQIMPIRIEDIPAGMSLTNPFNMTIPCTLSGCLTATILDEAADSELLTSTTGFTTRAWFKTAIISLNYQRGIISILILISKLLRRLMNLYNTHSATPSGV